MRLSIFRSPDILKDQSIPSAQVQAEACNVEKGVIIILKLSCFGGWEAREMSLQLREFAALSEDPGSVSGTYMATHNSL